MQNLDCRDLVDISSSPTISSLNDNDPVTPPLSSCSNRILLLFFDGTGDQFNSNNSNVVQFFSMLVKNDPSQLVYYQPGIGTYTIPEVATHLKAKISHTVDMMLGNHLDAHVMSGYEFLMQNYKTGDKICIFGFSRGAYTARALAGMVNKVGLIPHGNHQQIPFAYDMYSRDNKQGWEESNAFKRAFSVHVEIEFVGVWETVSAVGLIPRTLPFARRNNSIKYFRHALSLDERRVRFKPSTWKYPSQHSPSDREANVEEVWFAGNHGDVGGGCVKNNTRNSLARIPLRWMIRECFKAKVGILFHRHMFKYIGMDPKMLYADVHKPRPTVIYHSPSIQCPSQSSAEDLTEKDPEIIYRDFESEELEDVADAISPAHDQLDKSWLWWILECTPQPVFYQDEANGEHIKVHMVNMGHGRHISRKHIIKIHRSVGIRMKADCFKDGKYRPKAQLPEVFEWVE